MSKDKLSSPMSPPYAHPDPRGDRRDIYDHNPSTNLQVAHDRGKHTLSLNFVEETDAHAGSRIGRTADLVPDILSSAMGGQRRAATAGYESEPSIHRTQDNDLKERAERYASTAPYDPFKREDGRE